MLAIRLQRNGRSGYPVYRVIVQEANRHPLSGRVVAYLGSYNPHTKETAINKELAEKYLSNGAQPSSRVVRVLKSQGVTMPKWVKEPAPKTRAVRNLEKLRKNRPVEETPAEEPVTEEVPAEEAAPVENPDAEAAPTEEPAAEAATAG
ncbi:MAG: 30S ribosomal protein S16 [Candidatus Nomurabacteria bacterium]|jgi:small subunit ribosomal protein S16|nr:30S ribosomal protein S16 [Candidatus Nomurabacteria bacterium]